MHAATFLWELGAFFVYFLYTSFFEWTLHRYVFHTPKYIYSMFRKHTLVHHQIYKGDDTYCTEDEHPESVPMNWWALPMMILIHLPLFVGVQYFTGIPSLWGAIIALSLYYGLYESLHWSMHVPRAAKFLSQFRVYRFLDDHHHVHHKYMLSNLNVILPVPDLLFGTLRDRDGVKINLRTLMTRKATRRAALKQAQPIAQSPAVPTPLVPTPLATRPRKLAATETGRP